MSGLKCAMNGRPITANGDAIWDDGEWISWEWINQNMADPEDEDWVHPLELGIDVMMPPTEQAATLEMYELFGDTVELARRYFEITGRHLPVYGELGEIYAVLKHGLKRFKENTAGADGKIGNDIVEVKTISPHKMVGQVQVKRAGNFDKLLIVKISSDMKFNSVLIDRKDLKNAGAERFKANWLGSEDVD
jgi:hypothetical protein